MSQQREKRVLFVSYLFPPVGDAGVQRVTKFVKYLPEHGWRCSVLTAANPPVPLTDDSLARDVPPETIVRRCRTLEPGDGLKESVAEGGRSRGWSACCRRAARRIAHAILLPDPQVLWRPFALRAGRRLLREMPHDAIVATGPPFSSLRIGAELARQSGLPLVLDYRDEWGIGNSDRENKRPGRIVNRLQWAMQRSAVRAARVLLATTSSSALHLAQIADQAGADAEATWIYNGFDADDFPPLRSNGPRTDYGHGADLYRLSFVGTLWNRSPIGPVVSGIQHLAQTHPELAARLELVVAGRRTEAEERELDRLHDLPCKSVRLPFLPHDEAVRLMQESDALLLLNADRPETHRIVNAKTFEYMAARRPIFAVAPKGDLWDLVRPLPGAVLCEPKAEAAIAETLARQIVQHGAGRLSAVSTSYLEPFERRHLAGELAVLLDGLLAEWERIRTANKTSLIGENAPPTGRSRNVLSAALTRQTAATSGNRAVPRVRSRGCGSPDAERPE